METVSQKCPSLTSPADARQQSSGMEKGNNMTPPAPYRMGHKWKDEAQPATVPGSLNIQLDAASDLPIMEQIAEGLAKNLSRVIDAFRSLDADGSGTIDKKEWREGLARVGLAEVPHETVDALFDEIDADHSGEIEYNELSRKLRKQNVAVAES